MATYNVDATKLEGILLQFKYHRQPTLNTFHHILNEAYGLSIYGTDINFLFDDVPTNGLTKILDTAPTLLRTKMIDNIKDLSGATSRSETDKVENLFGKMKMGYRLKNGDDIEFERAQELAKGIDFNLKKPIDGVPDNCVVIYFSCSAVYPSLVGMIDGFDMDQLFTRRQAAPASVTSPSSGDKSLEAISTAMTNISSKNAARSADNDKEETIDYKDMPKDVRERCHLKNDPVKIIAKRHLIKFNNTLTLDKANVQQDWNFVEYPEVGVGADKPGQTYLIMKDGTLFGHLAHQGQKQKLAFVQSAMPMTEWSPKEWFRYCMMMERAAAINRIWLHTYYCRKRNSPNKWGFLCADPEENADADLPLKYQDRIAGWGVQIMQYLIKTLPKEATNILKNCGTDGHAALQLINLQLHPLHFLFQIDECRVIPVQGSKSFAEYANDVGWHRINNALIRDHLEDPEDELTQDVFISNMSNVDEIRNIVAVERHSPHAWISDRYKNGNFENTIGRIDGNISAKSRSRGRSQTRINSITPSANPNRDLASDNYNYCSLNGDPDFSTYHSLMSIAYSGCDESKLAYEACQHERKIFSTAIMAISNNLGRAFDTTRPCAICGTPGHTFEGCQQLQCPIAIKKAYIQLRVALQKIKGMGTNQNRDVNSLRALTIGYVNSVVLLPPSQLPAPSDASSSRMDKLERTMRLSMEATHQANKKVNSLQAKLAGTASDDHDDDDESQSSLTQDKLANFLMGAQF
jgi:hypothetical protein